MTDDLRQRIADTIRNAACPGDCGQTEEECREQRLQPVVWHHGMLAEVDGTPEQIADALLPLVTAERANALREGADLIDADNDCRCDQGYTCPLCRATDRLRARADATKEQP